MEVKYNSDTNLPKYPNQKNKFQELLQNPNLSSILLLVGIIGIYLLIFSFLGNAKNVANNGTTKSGFRLFEIIIFTIFIIVVIINIRYFANNPDFKFDAYMKNIFYGGRPEVDITVTGDSNKKEKEKKEENKNNEVFHIPNNVYTYEDSKALCKAYDSELATYDQIENAYEKGANWCSYGWSEGQLALFPTQKSQYEKLQKMKGHENDCGRTGVNGGFIDNPNVRFGVNCFGPKPLFNENDGIYMDRIKDQPMDLNKLKENKKADDFKRKLNEIVVAPFNYNLWSKHKPNPPKNNKEDVNPPEGFSSSFIL